MQCAVIFSQRCSRFRSLAQISFFDPRGLETGDRTRVEPFEFFPERLELVIVKFCEITCVTKIANFCRARGRLSGFGPCEVPVFGAS